MIDFRILLYATRAAEKIMHDLCDRGGIKRELQEIKPDILEDIIREHAHIIYREFVKMKRDEPHFAALEREP